MTGPQSENNTRNFNQPQVSPLVSPTPQIHLPESPYQLQKDIEIRPMENVTNPDEGNSNESLLILLNEQEDLQKQSFNIGQDATHRQEYDNLMRDIPIYDGRNMDLADWQLQIEKVASLPKI